MKNKLNPLLVFALIVSFLSGCKPAKDSPHLDDPPPQVGTDAPHELQSTGVASTPGLSPIAAPLDAGGMPIEQFFEESFQRLLLRDPEWITWEGLGQRYGVGDDRLTNLSDAYIRETQALQRQILDQLRTYDRAGLTPEQQVSYDTYEWYLQDQVDGQAFMYSDYPVNPLGVLGVQYAIIGLFTDAQPMENLEDARAYISRLGQVKTKFDQVIEGLKLREQAGVIAPQMVLQWSLGDIDGIGRSPARSTIFYTNFQQKLRSVTGVNDAEKQALLGDAEQAIQDSVLPAYQALADEVRRLIELAPTDFGAWQYPQGEAYYNYLIRHFTTTDLTAAEIHQLGLDEMKRVQGEMRAIFDQLGYPQDESYERLFARLAQDSGSYYGSEILEAYEIAIQFAEQNLDAAFDLRPQAKLLVKSLPAAGAAYYSSASLDGSRPGMFYAPGSGAEPKFKVPTLAYHEAVPGHHFQISIQREMDLPLFRNVLTFNAYAEGWALYAERLAGELGWYKDDPYGDLGRLQAEAWRAARLVVDTGLHSKKWSFDQTVDFLVENTGQDRRDMQYETMRYITWPGQALSYDIGLVKLLELRQVSQEKLGGVFDLKAFHRLVLSSGSVPLNILEGIILGEGSAAGGLVLTQLDDFPLYEMHYAGNYGFGEYLQTGQYPTGVQGLRARPDRFSETCQVFTNWGCTTFAALNPADDLLLGRNFDWYVHPALILFTDPPDGFASVSMVDISYVGVEGEIDTEAERQGLPRAPYLPFDGMNEHGLAVGMMAISHAEGGRDPGKRTLDSLEVIRLLLDYARTVDEALALLGNYNVDFEGGPPVHYLIADRSGASAVVEYLDGAPVVLRNTQPWQVATNFILQEEQPVGAASSCRRYNQAYTTLESTVGALSMDAALTLLQNVSQSGDFPTIWSVVYNLTRGEVLLVVGRKYDRVYRFEIAP